MEQAGVAHDDAWRDREQEARAPFEVDVRRRLAEQIDGELIDEHRRSPTGRHTPALAHVLAHLRQAPVAGKLLLHAVEPGRRWAVLRLSGQPGSAHEPLDDRVFDDLGEAEQAVFLRRLADLGALPTEHA